MALNSSKQAPQCATYWQLQHCSPAYWGDVVECQIPLRATVPVGSSIRTQGWHNICIQGPALWHRRQQALYCRGFCVLATCVCAIPKVCPNCHRSAALHQEQGAVMSQVQVAHHHAACCFGHRPSPPLPSCCSFHTPCWRALAPARVSLRLLQVPCACWHFLRLLAFCCACWRSLAIATINSGGQCHQRVATVSTCNSPPPPRPQTAHCGLTGSGVGRAA